MYISTLPDEMLATVLKYSKISIVRKMRKMNERIDKIARRANISTNVPLERLEFKQNISRIDVWVMRPFDEEQGLHPLYCCSLSRNVPLCPKFVGRWMSRAAHSRHLIIASIEFFETMFDATRSDRNSFRQLTYLNLSQIHFSASKEMFKQFFNNYCKNLKDLEIRSCRGMIENVFNTEALGKRQWRTLKLQGNEYNPGDKFLIEIAPNCKEFCYHCDVAFTVAGVLKANEECEKNGNYNDEIDLGIVHSGTTPPSEVEHLVRSSVGRISEYTYYAWSIAYHKIKLNCGERIRQLSFYTSDRENDIEM